MTTTEEVQALRDTIATLRQRIADLESAQTLGAADRVILRAMEGREMTRAQVAGSLAAVDEFDAAKRGGR